MPIETCSTLARRLRKDQTTIFQAVSTLERKGLVKKTLTKKQVGIRPLELTIEGKKYLKT